MLIEIDDWRSVGDLQYRFNKCFPNLHLQVFDAHAKGTEMVPLPGECLIENIRRNHSPGVLNIKSWYTCNEVEQLLAQQYGIKVRVVLQEEMKASPVNWGNTTLQDLNAKGGNRVIPMLVSNEVTDELDGW